MPDLDYDPKDDLEHVDYSQPIDHSAGSEPSSYLSSREHAQNPNPGQQNENNITNPDVLSKRENTASGSGSGTGANPQMASDGYYRRNVRQHSPSSAAAKKILKKFIQRYGGGILVGGLAGGSFLGVILGGPSLLLDNFAHVMETKFDTASQGIKRKATSVLKCTFNAECRKKTPLAKFTKKVADGLKNNHAKLVDAKTGKEITDPSDPNNAPPGDDIAIDTTDGTVNKDNVEGLTSSKPALENTLASATPGVEGSNTTHGDGTAENVENRLKIDKDTTAHNQEDDPNKPSDEDIKKNRQAMVDDGTTSPDVVGADEHSVQAASNSKMLDVVNNGSPKAPGTDSKAANEEDPNKSFEDETAKAKSDAKQNHDDFNDLMGGNDPPQQSLADRGMGAAKDFATGAGAAIVQTICLGQQVFSGINLAAKTIKMLSLVGFGFQFMKIASEIRGAAANNQPGPTPEEVSRLAGILTTTKIATDVQTLTDANGNKQTVNKGDTTLPSATDSFGYKFAAYGDTDMSSATQRTFVDFGTTGLSGPLGAIYQGVNKFVNAIPKGRDLCNFANSTWGAILGIAEGVLEAALSAVTVGTAEAATQSVKAFSKEGISLIVKGLLQDETRTLIAKAVGKYVLKSGLQMLTMSILIDGISKFLVNAAVGKFMSILPVGADAGDAITSGMGAYEGQIAQMGGNAPLTTTQGAQQIADARTYQHDQTALAMARDPWNIYDNNTAIGSIAGNFVASLYSKGSSPLGMAQSLLGMFGSSFNGFVNGLSPAYADASDIGGYTNQCQDPDANSIAPNGQTMAIDPFCNQMFGLPSQDDMDITDVTNQMGITDYDGNGTAKGNETFIDGSGNAVGDFKKFLKNCVNRGAPLGMTSDSGESSGNDCLIDDTSNNGGHNKLFYNYIQYKRAADGLNQGSDLGSQADGSASS